MKPSRVWIETTQEVSPQAWTFSSTLLMSLVGWIKEPLTTLMKTSRILQEITKNLQENLQNYASKCHFLQGSSRGCCDYDYMIK